MEPATASEPREFPLGAVDWKRLGLFLNPERAPFAMSVAALDGFLTGVAIGPEVVMPSEWLPVIWGEEEPEFADLDEANAVLGAIMSRYNEIITQLDAGYYAAPTLGGADRKAKVKDWANGFAEAIELGGDSWEAMFVSDEMALLFVILVHASEGEEFLAELPKRQRRELQQTSAEAIPPAVAAIAAYWRKRRARREGGVRVTETPFRVRSAPQPGRNDPCSCGSGRKYKKCCGGVAPV
jgi:uncharacterized protein